MTVPPLVPPSVTRRLSVPAPLAALLGGLLTTATVPPFGWWPLAVPGIALLVWALAGAGPRRRLWIGLLFGVGLYVPSVWWMTAFTLPGGVFVGVLESLITALCMVAVHPGVAGQRLVRWPTAITVPAALVLADVLRCQWPFGGLPLGGIDLGQAAGPLAATVTFGGRLLLIAITAGFGACLAVLVAKRYRGAVATLVMLCALTLLVRVAPDGTHRVGTITVAAVQGGGPVGLRASEENAANTWKAHVAATALITTPVDLILWPENTVSVERFAGSSEERTLKDIARTHHATVAAGLVEGAGPDHFLNAQVAWGPDGTQVARFDKVRRVPYGEYFPFRAEIERWGLATLPERSATPGTGPGIMRTPAGPFAVAISYEGFFDDRTRGGVRAGGQAVLIPTNAASYARAQLPTQQLAAARLRARETGRWVVQAAPTGFSAVFDNRGRMRQRTDLRQRAVLLDTIALRRGLTPYVRFNDLPMMGLMAAALVAVRAVRFRPVRQA